jgi:ribosomal protein L6P/L9E
MNKYLTLVLALTVVSAPAFASRARLESLGESKGGSYYIDDARNIFLNPAEIVHYKKKLFLELGGTNAGHPDSFTSYAGGTYNNVTAARGEGGWTNTFGDFTYGVYINNDSERTLQIVDSLNAGTGKGFLAPTNTLEFFLAGESAMNWGFSVFYAGNDSKASGTAFEQRASQLGVRLGVDVNALQVFTTVGIISTSENDTATANKDEIKGKVGIDAGVTYKMNEMTAFGKFTATGADYNTAGATAAQVRNTVYGVGAGWKREMTKSTNLFSRLEIDMGKVSNSGSDTKTYNLPIVVGAEAQALSWLTIRGSIASSIIGQAYTSSATAGTTRTSLAGDTTVGAGLGLTFGDVQIDGLVASTHTSAPGAAVAGFGSGPQANSTFGFGDGMLSRLALTYNF